jgi:hypothetical protein
MTLILADFVLLIISFCSIFLTKLKEQTRYIAYLVIALTLFLFSFLFYFLESIWGILIIFFIILSYTIYLLVLIVKLKRH